VSTVLRGDFMGAFKRLDITRGFLAICAGLTGVVGIACGGASPSREPGPGEGTGATAHDDGGSGGSSTPTSGGSTPTEGGSSTTEAGGTNSGTAGSGVGSAGGSVAAAGSGSTGGSSASCTYELPSQGPVCACPEIDSRQNCTATAAQPILDDGEDAPNGAPRGDFGGWWGHWQPTDGNDCFQQVTQGWGNFPGNPPLPSANPFDTGSVTAMSIKGASCNNADAWIGGLEGWAPGCDNVSAFTGFTVDIIADQELDGEVFMADSTSVSNTAHVAPIHVTTEWQRIELPFCVFSDANTFNAASVTRFGFRFSGTFQVWIDDIIFY
jgi:hypothetical protein